MINICKHGTHKKVTVINPNQNKKEVVIDACIADEIQYLNDKGIVTLSCCCGHGRAGQIAEYSNGFGNWKTYYDPPITLINEQSIDLAKDLGYRPFPYYYADGVHKNVWQMHLKTGCITQGDCNNWHLGSNLNEP